MDKADLLAALAAVEGAAGRIAAPRLADGVLSLLLDVTGLAGDARRALEARVREKAAALPGIAEIRLALTEEKIGRTIVAIASGKGGVGKSTVAANLAIALARLGREIGLIDADIYGPSQPRIMGTAQKPEVVGKQMVPVRAWGISMLSIGQVVAPGTALAWRGPMAASALGQLLDGDWGAADLLIVDLPPGTGDVQLSLIQKWKPAGAVIVSTPQDLALIDAARAIDLFRKTDIPLLGLIENMSGYACPHCGEVSDPFGAGGAEAAAGAMGIPFLGRIPLALSIRSASDEGVPPAAGESEEAAIFKALAERLLARLNPAAAAPIGETTCR